MTSRLPAKVGLKFRPWSTDAIGVVTKVVGAPGHEVITYVFDHSPEATHQMGRDEFTTRFAEKVESS